MWATRQPSLAAAVVGVLGYAAVMIPLRSTPGDRWPWDGLWSLPDPVYAQPSILVGVLLGVDTSALALILALAFGLWQRRLSWSDLGLGPMRWVILASIVLMAVAASTYAYNFYFDRAHLADRLAVAALALAAGWRPGFVPLFGAVAVIVGNQFLHPFGAYTWTDKLLPIHLLLLLSVMLPLWLVARRRQIPGAAVARGYWLAALALVAAHYFVPGVSKLSIDWHEHTQLHWMSHAAYVNGWLRPVDETTIRTWIDASGWLNPLMVWGTLAIEVGSILMLWRRGLAVAALLGFIGLHGAIFATTGIFFWKWVVVDAALLAALWRLPPAERRWLFSPATAGVFTLLVLSAPFTFRPPPLAWYPTPLVYTFEFVGTDATGRRWRIDKYLWKPYDISLSQNRLWFAAQRRFGSLTYSDTQDLKALLAIQDATPHREWLSKIEAEVGVEQWDPQRTRELQRFMRAFLDYANRGGRSFVGSPIHIWTLGGPGSYAFQVPLTRIDLDLVVTFYDPDRGIVRLDRQPLLSTDGAAGLKPDPGLSRTRPRPRSDRT